MSQATPDERALEAIRWFVRYLTPGSTPPYEEVVEYFGEESASDSMARFKNWSSSPGGVAEVLSTEVTPVGAGRAHYRAVDGSEWDVDLSLDADTGVIRVVINIPRADVAVEVSSPLCSALSADERSELHALFAACYRDADPDYLERSIELMHVAAMARVEGQLVGFQLVAAPDLELPDVGQRVLAIGGLACVSEAVRRLGVWNQLRGEGRRGVMNAVLAGDLKVSGLATMGAARFATPASFRPWLTVPNLVPVPGAKVTPAQVRIGTAIAKWFGCDDFDAEHFVCRGRGRPIGDPILEVEVEDAEWERFAHVNRARGDSLLAVWWQEDPQDVWFAD